MKWCGLIALAVLASQALPGSDDGNRPGDQRPAVTLPAVLHKSEPKDSVVVRLPGIAPPVASDLPATEVRLAPPAPDLERPVFRRPKRDFPADFERNSGEYLDQQIGVWQQIDAAELLGEPTHKRPAFADDLSVNGQILAFPDPTGRYKEVELDFDMETGLLRTLFAYPNGMSWQECRRAFGGNVRATQANKGRTFYSYLDRRLDVLVDAAGKVISLGMY